MLLIYLSLADFFINFLDGLMFYYGFLSFYASYQKNSYMKLRLFLSLFLLFSFKVDAQQTLTKSRQSGSYTYIYRLTDQETFKLALNGREAIDDSFMHTVVDSFEIGKNYRKTLPYGNYLYATPIKNKWNYRLEDVRNVDVAFVNNQKDFQFYVKDLYGNLITDALVQVGKRKAKLDEKTGLYQSSYKHKQQVIKVHYQGINNYFSFEIQKPYRPQRNKKTFQKNKESFLAKHIWQPIKNLFGGGKKNKSASYRGYMVFSKPKYKPLDTVKFKAYVVDEKGKNIKPQPIAVFLKEGAPSNKQKKIATVQPYRAGGYEHSFVLADTLNLTLDKRYEILLKEEAATPDKSQTLITGNFRYEDYELKSINFSLRADKSEYKLGTPVTLYMKATDENNLVVPDGRVELTVTTSFVKKYADQRVFVPDTLWTKKLSLDPVGETKLVIPDSVFPKADITLRVRAKFLNSNNESRTGTQNLTFLYADTLRKEIMVSLEKDSLNISYQENQQNVPQKLLVKSYSFNDKLLDSVWVQAPARLKADYRAECYEIESLNGVKDMYFLTEEKPSLSASALQTKDSLRVVINNRYKVPFWYTVFSGNKTLFKGYGTALDTTVKHNGLSKAAHIRTSFFWDERERTTEVSAVYNANKLNVKLLGPSVVYPGQTVSMLVNVTDVNHKPVPMADVTAYAATSKFRVNTLPNLPSFAKQYYRRKTKNKIEADEIGTSGTLKLNWQKWSKQLGLDSIAYYQFTHPEDIYMTTEDAKDSITQILPFVVVEGEIQPAEVVYINNLPVFYSQSDQIQSYAFNVRPGKHTIALRTRTRKVVIREVEVVKGKKTILSVMGEPTNTRATVTVENPELSDAEATNLDRFMMKVVGGQTNYEKKVLKADSSYMVLNLPSSYKRDLLIGPIKERLLTYEAPGVKHSFIREHGYAYTFMPSLIRQKSYYGPYAFNKQLTTSPKWGNNSYLQQVIRKAEIDSIWNEHFNLRSRTTRLFLTPNMAGEERGKLLLKLADTLTKTTSYLKNIIISHTARPDFMLIQPGNYMRNMVVLPTGMYRIMFLLRDNSYYTVDSVYVKKNGINYYEWDKLPLHQPDERSIKIDSYIKSVKDNRPNTIAHQALEDFNDKDFDTSLLVNTVYGRVLDEKDKAPLLGVVVKVVGLNVEAVTNNEGFFEIKTPVKGQLTVSWIGYLSVTKKIVKGDIGNIYLKRDAGKLEVVMITMAGESMSNNNKQEAATLQQRPLADVPGDGPAVRIRGFSSITNDNNPLYIVDGVPYEGVLSNINPDNIEAISILKDEAATALYGARAANGVVIVTTKQGTLAATTNQEMVVEVQQSSMRTNFSDEGFWKPKLITDEDGNAGFFVKFPDDITSWQTNVIAMNGNKQSGTTTTTIKSFKSLSANFVSPQFATQGDSIHVIGKLMNYTSAEEKMQRKFLFNDEELLNATVNVKNSLIDTVAIKVTSTDSLKFEYTLHQDNGYFDGEIRKINVVPVGVKETKGFFASLNQDTVLNYNFETNLGAVTMRAEASVFPVLLDEMRHLRNYEYQCNEQLASKLKGLLLEKRVRAYLKQPFEHDNHIKNIIKKLQSNRKKEGLWGWWPDSPEEIWISLHVVEALLLAEKDGFKIDLDKEKLYNYLLTSLAQRQDYSQLHAIELLWLLNRQYDMKDWLKAIENNKELKPNQYQKLRLMKLKQLAGLTINFDSLMKDKKQTMFGNSYWGEVSTRFWDNSMQNTVLAYQIIDKVGKKDELPKITNYFLEQRKDGKWRNTYESALVLETILPHLLAVKEGDGAAKLIVNGKEVEQFPYQEKVEQLSHIEIQKTGKMPVYFTAYQQYHNAKPEKVDKEFTVRTSMVQKGVEVPSLKAGEKVTLKVEVEVKADADYIMIEVPIPAGCSYENKIQNFWGIEAHREYFKEKTSIFCAKLKQGKYTFNIDLMPRYSGVYMLNPAKAEMMYFPVFYGREGLKKIVTNP